MWFWHKIFDWLPQKAVNNSDSRNCNRPCSKHKDNRIASNIAALSDAKSYEDEASRKEQKPDYHIKECRDWITLLFVILTTVGIFYQANIFSETMNDARNSSNRQSRLMEGQLGIMEVDQRPWISVQPFIKSITWDNEGAHIAINYNLKNTGHSLAENVFIQDDALLYQGQDYSNKLNHLSDLLKKQVDVGFPMLPNQAVPFERPDNISTSIPLKDIDKLDDGTGVSFLIVYGVDYVFGPDKSHHQTVCVLLINQIDRARTIKASSNIPIGKDLSEKELSFTYFTDPHVGRNCWAN